MTSATAKNGEKAKEKKDQKSDQGRSPGKVTFMLKFGKEVARHRRDRGVLQSGKQDPAGARCQG